MTDRTVTIDEQIATLQQAQQIAERYAALTEMTGDRRQWAARHCAVLIANLADDIEATRP